MKKIPQAPAAFANIAKEFNDAIAVCSRVNAMIGSGGITVVHAEKNILVGIDTKALGSAIAVAIRSIRTFFAGVSEDEGDVTVSSGAINNVACDETTLTPDDGDFIYINAELSSGVVTAVTVEAAGSFPTDTSSNVYKLIATVVVVDGVATATPVGWNFTEMQVCSGQSLWGGFGQ